MVYFISDGTYTKIGKSNNPIKRIKDLQTSNGNELKFVYIFDCKDSWEKKLHKLLKQYRTNSCNEWFDLRMCKLEEYFKMFDYYIFQDLNLAKFKANQANNEFYKGAIHTGESRNNKINTLYGAKNKHKYKALRLELIEEIKLHLATLKNKIISYDYYIKKYGFTKNEISFFMKGCKLSKAINDHNQRVYNN
jgi:hypothetical protein